MPPDTQVVRSSSIWRTKKKKWQWLAAGEWARSVASADTAEAVF
jgi:hypothetical protein